MNEKQLDAMISCHVTAIFRNIQNYIDNTVVNPASGCTRFQEIQNAGDRCHLNAPSYKKLVKAKWKEYAKILKNHISVTCRDLEKI